MGAGGTSPRSLGSWPRLLGATRLVVPRLRLRLRMVSLTVSIQVGRARVVVNGQNRLLHSFGITPAPWCVRS